MYRMTQLYLCMVFETITNSKNKQTEKYVWRKEKNFSPLPEIITFDIKSIFSLR